MDRHEPLAELILSKRGRGVKGALKGSSGVFRKGHSSIHCSQRQAVCVRDVPRCDTPPSPPHASPWGSIPTDTTSHPGIPYRDTAMLRESASQYG